MSLYFAFGSNMSTARLREPERAPSADPRGTAYLTGYDLRFHKRSRKDGSGKADALRTERAEDVVWGVLFEIRDEEWSSLDRAEGSGYDRVPVHVTRASDHQVVEAQAYIATPDAIDESLQPLHSYMALVLAGAREHGLPAEYTSRLEAVGTLRDADAPA